MVNIFLVVIASQFSETKRRETERITIQRLENSHSASFLNLSDNLSDLNSGCWWKEFITISVRLMSSLFKKIFKFYKKITVNESNFVKFNFINFSCNFII